MGDVMGSTGHRARWLAGRFRGLKVACVLGAALVLVVLAPGVGYGAVTVSRAEVNGGNLRIEGTAAANRTITVDGVAMGTSDGAGRFRVERAGFTAPADCTVAVNDGSATAATATLAGCTVSAPPPSTAPPLVALTLSQTTVVGGTPVTATVSLTSSAPAGSVVVWLSSDNPTAATVPPSVTVPAGATAATFTVTTNRWPTHSPRPSSAPRGERPGPPP